jgi:hypothetical protein
MSDNAQRSVEKPLKNVNSCFENAKSTKKNRIFCKFTRVFLGASAWSVFLKKATADPTSRFALLWMTRARGAEKGVAG